MSRRSLWVVPFVAGIVALFTLIGLRPKYFVRLFRRLEGRLAPPPSMKPDVSGSLLADPREAIATLGEAYREALLAGNAVSYAATYCDDGLAMPGTGMVARGRTGIEQAIAQTFTTMRFLEAEMATVDLRLNGETAIETGHYRFLINAFPEGVPRPVYGRYAIVWKRIADDWRIALDVAQPWVVES